jgi:hypothetical protein
MSLPRFCLLLFIALLPSSKVVSAEASARLEQPPNTWVKRSPVPGGPLSPQMGYESSWGYDPRARVLIRWGGHNQGGGGEQNAETWTFDPLTARWTLKEPNDAPPGVCCAQQNVFDQAQNRFLRFPAFSGSHGWQWFREIYLKNSSVWAYDLAGNCWRDRRPLPEPHLAPYRCSSWDSDHEVAVVFGGEGSHEGTLVYDPYTNTWTNRHAPAPPADRSGGNLAYDAAHRLHILFGAQYLNDPHTWVYDLRANRWLDLRSEQLPPCDANDAVLAYDSLNRVVIAVVKITQGKDERARHRLETWSFDAGRHRWTRMNPPSDPAPSGNRARMLTFLPNLGLAILENRTHQPHGPAEQQIWTYRSPPSRDEPPPSLLPPGDLRLTTNQDSANLSWKPSPSPGVISYVISRGAAQYPWEVAFKEIGRVTSDQTTYHDTGLKRGTVYHYTVQAVGCNGQPGPQSMKARSQPRIVEDLVVSVLSDKEIALSWTPPEGKDIVGYHVERAAIEVWSDDQLTRLKKRLAPLPEPSVGSVRRIGSFRLITTAPLSQTSWTDRVDLTRPQLVAEPLAAEKHFYPVHLDEKGRPYRWGVCAYRVRAVNSLGVASGPSPYILTIPSAPQVLFSREQQTTCDLKWQANPEKGLRGYRIYRLDGRFDNQPITRLTPEPIAAQLFSDREAGRATRRYHVVAVDALGQEGIPSQPVWFEREWKKYYVPFIGAWHQ